MMASSRGLAPNGPTTKASPEALLAGYGLLGKTAAAFVALPALPVTKDNLLDAWQIVYRQPAPFDRHPADVLGRVTSWHRQLSTLINGSKILPIQFLGRRKLAKSDRCDRYAASEKAERN
jgi:hypothetical protein